MALPSLFQHIPPIRIPLQSRLENAKKEGKGWQSDSSYHSAYFSVEIVEDGGYPLVVSGLSPEDVLEPRKGSSFRQ